MAWGQYSFVWQNIEHHLVPLTSSEISAAVSWPRRYFQKKAKNMAKWLCDQLERDMPSVARMPMTNNVIIVGRDLDDPCRVIVVVNNLVSVNTKDSILLHVKMDSLLLSEFAVAKAKGYNVFVIA